MKNVFYDLIVYRKIYPIFIEYILLMLIVQSVSRKQGHNTSFTVMFYPKITVELLGLDKTRIYICKTIIGSINLSRKKVEDDIIFYRIYGDHNRFWRGSEAKKFFFKNPPLVLTPRI